MSFFKSCKPDTNFVKIPDYFEIALKEFGVREVLGSDHNTRILDYHASTVQDNKSDEAAWCSAFVNWCVSEGGLQGTGSALARSWTEWGEAAQSPSLGDVVVFHSKKNNWSGHVGFFIKESDDAVLVLGGNQNNEVNITWYKKRGKSLNLKGYRRYES